MPRSGLAAQPHRLGVFALLRSESRVEQEPGHPDDAVERRANFVAHIVEKLGAQACGFERQVARAGDLVLGALTQFGRGHALIGDDRVAPPYGLYDHNVNETYRDNRHRGAHHNHRPVPSRLPPACHRGYQLLDGNRIGRANAGEL